MESLRSIVVFSCLGFAMPQGELSGFEALAGAEEAQPSTEFSNRIAGRIPKEETGSETDHLTGDWGGLRSKLIDRGVHLYAGYSGEVLGNVSGGIRRGAVYEALFEVALDLDSGKLGLWEKGLLHASALYPHGSGLSAKYVADLLTVSNIDAYDSLRLYELWLEQSWAGERFSLRCGQLLADQEFAGNEAASSFLQSAFGWPAFISGNTINTGPAFYAAALGVRLRFSPNENWYFQSGLYDGDTFDNAAGDPRVNAQGTRFHLSEEQGFFSLSEAGYRLHPSGGGGLPGEYKAGFWFHSGEFKSNFYDRHGDPFIVSGLEPANHGKNFGAYIASQQTVWKQGAAELILFSRAGGSPPDRSLFEFVFDGGFSAKGFLPGRGEDEFGAGVAYARLSRDIQKAERLDVALNGKEYRGFSDRETVLELFYSAKITPWWTIQPDFQWVFDPGGTSGGADAIILGVRSSIVF